MAAILSRPQYVNLYISVLFHNISPTGNRSLGTLVNEGKTKIMYKLSGGEVRVVLKHKSVMSVDDGVWFDVMDCKAALANCTNDNVFRLLNYAGMLVSGKLWGERLEYVCNDELDRRAAMSNHINSNVFRLLNFACMLARLTEELLYKTISMTTFSDCATMVVC